MLYNADKAPFDSFPTEPKWRNHQGRAITLFGLASKPKAILNNIKGDRGRERRRERKAREQARKRKAR